METQPLFATWLHLADMLTMVRGWTLLILEVKVTMDIQLKLVNSKSMGPEEILRVIWSSS